jgi:hypothetical protein
MSITSQVFFWILNQNNARFTFVLSFQPHYGPGFDSAFNKIVQGIFLGGKVRPARKADNITAIC